MIAADSAHPSPASPIHADTSYRVDFRVDDNDALQSRLNDLYGYRDDVATKVLHRCRLNLVFLLMRDLIDRHVVTEFATAVDIGCNAGFYSKLLSDFGFASVFGFDVDEAGVQKAQDAFAAHGLSFSVCRAEELTGAYDFVLCTEVIEHTEQPVQVVDNLKRSLKPGGVAIVSAPNRMSFPYSAKWAVYKLLRRPISDDMAAHLSYPSYRLLKLLAGDGVRICACDGTNLFLSTPLLKLLYGTRLFEPVNRINFRLARLWPLKYLSQFFFVVLERP